MKLKKKQPKLNETTILSTLLSSKTPIILTDLSSKLNCDEVNLKQYLDSLSQNGLVLTSHNKYNDNDKYSPKRLETAYSASSIAEEYLTEKKRAFLTFICTIIAAIMATLTLVVTIIIPFIS